MPRDALSRTAGLLVAGRTRFGFMAIAVLAGAVLPIRAPGEARSWMDRGAEFAAGSLGNSGQNLHVNRRGELETIRRFDLDGNGYIDLPFNSSHDNWHHVPATLVTAGPGNALEVSRLGVDGSARTLPADLNQDGFTDLVFMPNRQNVQRNRSSISIAWGAADGWSTSRLTRQLPVNGGFGAASGLVPALYGDDAIAVGDINGDDWQDIVTINTAAWLPGQPAGAIVRIYWGAAGGFLLTRYQDIGIEGALEVVAGRFGAGREFTAAIATRTGKLHYLRPEPDRKTAAVGRTVTLPLPAASTPSRMLAQPTGGGKADAIWIATSAPVLLRVGASGQPDDVQAIPAPAASNLAVGRLDDDEWPDLVLTSLKLYYPTDKVPEPPPASLAILWGTADGVDAGNPVTLAVPNAISAAIGDLNRDGHGDLAVSVHQGRTTTDASSRIFWGDGGRGFSSAAGLPVPTTGAQGVAIVQVTPTAAPVAIFNNCVRATLDSFVPVRLYWGTPDGFSREAMVDIPNLGGLQSCAADLNADGWVDLVVINGGDASPENVARAEKAGALVYWGGSDGNIRGPGPTRFDTGRYQVLRGPRLGAVNVADFNKDGHLDVVLGAFKAGGVVVHYGSAAGLRPENRTELKLFDGYQIGCLVVDGNADGWLDLVVTAYDNDKVVTYWGGPDGFSTSRATILDYPRPIDVEGADLNADGWVDLIVGSYIDPVADRSDMGLSILWGGPAGWKLSNSQWLPSSTVVGIAVADLDGDGFLDIVCPSYHGELSRADMPCYIYWGSAEGYGTRRRSTLIVDSGHDAVLADFDRDGMLDIAFCAHSLDPGHELDTPIFFNDGRRFQSPRVQRLPVIGPHFIWDNDIGRITDRRYEEEFTSRVLAWSDDRSAGRVEVDATAPFGARVAVAVRSASREPDLAAAAWRPAVDGAFSVAPGDRVLQYRLTLRSANGDAYPVVRQVAVRLP